MITYVYTDIGLLTYKDNKINNIELPKSVKSFDTIEEAKLVYYSEKLKTLNDNKVKIEQKLKNINKSIDLLNNEFKDLLDNNYEHLI